MLDADITLFQYAEDINCIKTDGHTHDWIELFYQVSGEKVHCIDGTFCFTRKGDMLLIAPRTAHRTTFAGKRIYSRYCIGFYAGFVKEIPELYEALCAVISKNKFIIAHFDDADRMLVTSLFATMYAGYRAQEPDSKTTLRMGTALCLLRMLRSYSTVGLQERAPERISRVISNVCAYIHEHFREDITLDILAQHANISPSYLSHKFCEFTASTIPGYVGRLRVEEARIELVSTDKSITEIALDVGFKSVSQFSRTFKALCGEPATALRERARREHQPD